MRTGKGEERESALRSGWTVEATPSEAAPGDAAGDEQAGSQSAPPVPASAASTDTAPDSEDGAHAAPASQMSNLTVVLLGVTGGLFMLYAWVWMSWAQYYAGVNAAVAAGSGSVGGVLQQIVFWIAPLAPVLWFLSALILTRTNTKRLVTALVLGLLITFPLPMVFLSGAAL